MEPVPGETRTGAVHVELEVGVGGGGAESGQIRCRGLVMVQNDERLYLAGRSRPLPRHHAWEPSQFPGWRGNMDAVASPYKPVHLVGDYGHLRYRAFSSGPEHVPRGVPVEIEPARNAEC